MTSRLTLLQLPDYTGGLVTNQPATELKNNESPDCDNIHVMRGGFEKRYGDSEFNSTAMNSGADVQMVSYYKEKGGNEYLVAIAGAKVFKSDSLDGTMDEITGSGHTAPDAAQNSIYTPVILNNLLCWFGPTAPQKWDGSTASNNYANLAGSPPTADFAFVVKDKCFAGKTTANPSALSWSVVSNIEDWTGTGSGSTTVVTNDGDNLVGGVPVNNNLSLLFKQYSIHHLITEQYPYPTRMFHKGIGACGKHAILNVDGLIYFITKEPRMCATDGYRIIRFPNSIDDLWDGIKKSRLAYIQGVYDPVYRRIHWIVSDGSATANNTAFIWDLQHECWLRNTTGFDCNVACVAKGYEVYGGHTNGKIYKKYDSSTYNDASETAPGAINAYWAYNNFNGQSNMSIIHGRYMDINYSTQTQASIKYAYGYDYQLKRFGEISAIGAGGRWDVDTWDGTFIWGGRENAQRRVFFYGRGNNFQVKLFNDNPGEPMRINNNAIAYREQGIKEFTSK